MNSIIDAQINFNDGKILLLENELEQMFDPTSSRNVVDTSLPYTIYPKSGFDWNSPVAEYYRKIHKIKYNYYWNDRHHEIHKELEKLYGR